MTSELKPATVFGSGIQTDSSGQSRHYSRLCSVVFFSRALPTAAAPAARILLRSRLRKRRYGSNGVRIETRYRLRERLSKGARGVTRGTTNQSHVVWLRKLTSIW